MLKNFDDMQKYGKDHVGSTMKGWDQVSKGVQAIATETADYSKKSFEEGSAAFEKLLGAKSLEKAIEIPNRLCQDRLRGLRGTGDQDGRNLCESRQGDLQVVREFRSQGPGREITSRRAIARRPDAPGRANARRVRLRQRTDAPLVHARRFSGRRFVSKIAGGGLVRG
jgi:hypothetical protein